MKEFYLNLIHSLPDIVYQIDDDGRFTFVNNSVKSLGYNKSDLLGKHFGVLVEPYEKAPVNRMSFVPMDAELEKKQKPQFFNERRTGKRITKMLKVRLKCKERGKAAFSEYREATVYATGLYEGKMPVLDFLGTVGVIRLSSNETESEMMISRVNRYYQLLIENSSEIISIIAHDGSILYVSKSSERNLGVSPIDLIGGNLEEIIHPDDLYHMENVFNKRIDYGKSTHIFELRMKHADGGWRYFESTLLPIMDAERKHVMCFVMHLTDITRRKEIEAALEKRERMYKLLLKTSPDAIVLFDKEGDLIMVNEKGASLMGGAREDLIGLNYTMFCRGEDRETVKSVIQLLGGVEDECEINITLIRLDCTTIPVEASFSSLKDDSGKLEGYLSVFRDISRRIQIEQNQRKLENELLSVVINRLSERELELLKIVAGGYRWPEKKREIGKLMDALPGTLDQFISRIKKKTDMPDIEKIAILAARHFKWTLRLLDN